MFDVIEIATGKRFTVYHVTGGYFLIYIDGAWTHVPQNDYRPAQPHEIVTQE